MYKVYVSVLLSVFLSGCAVYNDRTMPVEVVAIPNDCVNKKAIINWLESQSNQQRALLTSESQYAREQKIIKRKLWDIKYNCNR